MGTDGLFGEDYACLFPWPERIYGPLNIYPITNEPGDRSAIQHFPSETQTDMKQPVSSSDGHIMTDDLEICEFDHSLSDHSNGLYSDQNFILA